MTHTATTGPESRKSEKGVSRGTAAILRRVGGRKMMGIAAVAGLLLASSLVAFPAQPVELVGPLTREAILEALPEWAHEAAAYLPDPEIVEKLRYLDRPVHVLVVIGTWCPDCRRHLTAFFRLIEMADNPAITVEYVGLTRDKMQPEDVVRDNSIERVPTFIVFEDGREIGRIIEHPRTTVEADLAEILFGDTGRSFEYLSALFQFGSGMAGDIIPAGRECVSVPGAASCRLRTPN